MKINTKQKSAKEWNRSLSKLDQAQIGEIPITFADKDNKKRTGYIELTKIELEIGKKSIPLGKLLETLIKSNAELREQNNQLEKLSKTNAEEIKKTQVIVDKYFKSGVI